MEKNLIAFVVTTLLAVPMVFAQSDDTRLAHAKVFQLLKHSWLLESVSVSALSHESDKTKLSWIDEALGKSTMIYSLDDGLFGEKIAVFPAADRESNAEYFVIAFLETRKLLGVRPDVRSNRLVFFDFEINKSIEADPFIDETIKLYSGDLGQRNLIASYPKDLDRIPITHELVGETLQKATCIWNTVKTSLSVSGFRDLAKFICNFNTLADDAKQMVGLAKSVGGCVTGGVADCILATTEIGFLIADPACRPAWMNSCFADGVRVEWTSAPPTSLQNRQRFTVQWQITNGRSVEHTNVHFGTNRNTVTTGSADYGTTIQSGSPGFYVGVVDLSNLSFGRGTQLYFAAHARVDGKNYYGPISTSTIESDQLITVEWVSPPPSRIQKDQAFEVQWRIRGGTSVNHTNVHYGTNRDTVPTTSAGRSTTAQTGTPGVYSARISVASEPWSTGTQLYFAAHARVDGDNYYSNVVASTLESSDRVGNLQLTFNPNPATSRRTSNCDNNYYEFSFIVGETSGVDVTLTGFQVDGRDLPLSQIRLPDRIRANERITRGITWCRGTGTSTWTILGRDDNGKAGSWQGTIRLQ